MAISYKSDLSPTRKTIDFNFTGYIDNPSHWLGFFTTVAYTINCSINGWVYLIVNRTVQYQVRKMICSPKSYLRNSTKDETPSNTDDFTEDSRGTIPLKNSSHACLRDKYSGHNAADSGQLSTLLMISRESFAECELRLQSSHQKGLQGW